MAIGGHVHVVSVIGGGTFALVVSVILVVVVVPHSVHSLVTSDSRLVLVTVPYEMDGVELSIPELGCDLELDVVAELIVDGKLNTEEVLLDELELIVELRIKLGLDAGVDSDDPGFEYDSKDLVVLDSSLPVEKAGRVGELGSVVSPNEEVEAVLESE